MTGQEETTAAGSAVPRTAPTSLAGVVDACFDVAQGMLEAQRELVKELASSLRVGREPAPAAGDDTRQAAERERAERAERYRGQSRVQLVEDLRQRGLPRTGSKAELVERLLEADDR